MLTLYIEAPTWTKLQEEIARVMDGVAPAEGTAELTFTAVPAKIAESAVTITPGTNTHESAEPVLRNQAGGIIDGNAEAPGPAPKKRRGRLAKTEQPEAGAGIPSGRREAVPSPAATPAPTPTADDLRAAFECVASTCPDGLQVCLSLLQSAGYQFVREVKPEDRAALIDQCYVAIENAEPKGGL